MILIDSMDSNDVWVNRIWIRFEKSLFSLQSNHGIVHRERNHIANVHLQPIAAFHMTQHVASRQTNQSMKQTRDMLIASMSHCVNWSMQHTPEPNNSGIHSIKFSSTLDSPYFPQTILQHHLRQRHVVRIIRRAIQFEVNLIQIRKNPANRNDPRILHVDTTLQTKLLSYSVKRSTAEMTVFTTSKKTDADMQLSLMCRTMWQAWQWSS